MTTPQLTEEQERILYESAKELSFLLWWERQDDYFPQHYLPSAVDLFVKAGFAEEIKTDTLVSSRYKRMHSSQLLRDLTELVMQVVALQTEEDDQPDPWSVRNVKITFDTDTSKLHAD